MSAPNVDPRLRSLNQIGDVDGIATVVEMATYPWANDPFGTAFLRWLRGFSIHQVLDVALAEQSPYVIVGAVADERERLSIERVIVVTRNDNAAELIEALDGAVIEMQNGLAGDFGAEKVAWSAVGNQPFVDATTELFASHKAEFAPVTVQ